MAHQPTQHSPSRIEEDVTGADEVRRRITFWLKDATDRPVSQEAWARFVTELRAAAYNEQVGKVDDRLPEGMTVVTAAVGALLRFLEAHEFILQERIQIPIVRLAMGLSDISEGRPSPLFTPVRRGAARKRAVQANVSAMAAKALDELMASGESLNVASTMVSRAVRDGKLAGYSKCTAEKVRNWRARLEEGEGAEGVTAEAISRYRAPLPKEAGDSPTTRAAWLLMALRTSAVLRHG